MQLLFKIKTALMKFAMEQKRRKEPFDGVASDLFQLPPNAGPMINNSYFFGANGPDGHSLIMRVGHRNTGFDEVFVIYITPDGRFYTMEKQVYTADQSPLHVTCVTPEKHFKVWFDGNFIDTRTQEVVPAKFNLDFHATLPIFDAMQHSDFRGMAMAYARAKWNREFFREAGGDTGMGDKKNADQVNNIPQRHYEQAGHFTGQMTLGSEQITIDLPGSRDHAFGKRDWNYMSCHVWIMVTTARGETFNFSLVSYPKVKNVFCGYSNIGYGRDYSIIDYKMIEYSHNDGKAPDRMVVDCTLSNGKTVRLTTRRENNLYLEFDGGNFYFQEGVGEADIDGVKARGSLEFGYNRDKSRWNEY